MIGSLSGVQHLIEGNGIGRNRGIVFGDHLLGRHVQHLLHHVQLGADALDEGGDEVKARLQRAGITPEALDCIAVALRHGLDPGKEHQDDEDDQHDHDDVEAAEQHEEFLLSARARLPN